MSRFAIGPLMVTSLALAALSCANSPHKPSSELKWEECQGFLCAEMEVPLDYEDASAGTTNVKFVRADAEDPDEGTLDILVNPGGPGESGIDFVYNGIAHLRDVLGEQHNIIGFDPRGVGQSGPDIDCFGGNETQASKLLVEILDVVDIHRNETLAEAWNDAQQLGKICSDGIGKTSAKYVNTAAVAQDLIQFTELRSREHGRIEPGGTKVNFYGISYGTAIGSAFAALYPDRVGRFILNGVVDATDYFNGSSRTDLLEFDCVINKFFELCFDAREDCEFFRDDASAGDIRQRFDAIMEKLDEEAESRDAAPHPRAPPPPPRDEQLKRLIFQAAYATWRFPSLASSLADLEAGDSRKFAALYDRMVLEERQRRRPGIYSVLSRTVISCNDANGRHNISTFDQWTDYMAFLHGQSAYGAEVWGPQYALNCGFLHTLPPESQVVELSAFESPVEPSTPMLFLQNRCDPVTPAAEKMARVFVNSGLVTQESVGHAVQVDASECASDIVRAYLRHGTMPEDAEATCDDEPNPFRPFAPERRDGFDSRRGGVFF